MRCFTLVTMKTYNDMAFCAVENIPIVPLQEDAKSALMDILFTEWPKDADLALIIDVPDENVKTFSYYKYNCADMWGTYDSHYSGYVLEKVNGTIHDKGKHFHGMSVEGILSSDALRLFLANYNSDFLLYKIQPVERLDVYICRRTALLRDRVFNSKSGDADAVNSLLHMIETFRVLKHLDTECIEWCRANAPTALKFYKDEELIQSMCSAWLCHIDGKV